MVDFFKFFKSKKDQVSEEEPLDPVGLNLKIRLKMKRNLEEY